MTAPHTITCSHEDCDQEMYANKNTTEGYCPEHSGGRGHGTQYANKDHEHQYWERVDHRVKNNTVNQR